MIGLLLLASLATGVAAGGLSVICWILRLPFAGLQAAMYWTLAGACVLLGLAAAFLYFNDTDFGAFA